VARPLDGGAPTRKGDARTGEGTGRGAAAPPAATACSGGRWFFPLLRRRFRVRGRPREHRETGRGKVRA
jgi:hypothetical protein